MGFIDWVKKQMAAIALATASVEKNALGQQAIELGQGVSQEQRHKQGMLSDALTRGEITQEVKELRWRMYKVLQATDGVNVEITGYDDDGFPIVKVKDARAHPLRNVKVDEIDDCKVEMVVDNSEIFSGTDDAVDEEVIEGVNDSEIRDMDGDQTRTIGEIDGERFMTNVKGVRPVIVERDIRPKFEIEKYSKKVVIRKFSEEQKMIEFHLSKYPDEFDRKTRLIVSTLKKGLTNPRIPSLEISTVGFITNKTMGAKDFLLYKYKVDKVDKIIEFDGHYVVKFLAHPVINGESILEDFREEDLDKRYENKEAKK